MIAEELGEDAESAIDKSKDGPLCQQGGLNEKLFNNPLIGQLPLENALDLLILVSSLHLSSISAHFALSNPASCQSDHDHCRSLE